MEYFNSVCSKMKKRIGTESREVVKEELNEIFEFYYKAVKDKKSKYFIQLACLDLFILYAQKYACIETFTNVIRFIEKDKARGSISDSYPYQFRMIYGESLFGLYNAQRSGDNYRSSKDEVHELLLAKCQVLKAFQLVVGDDQYSAEKMSNTVVLLSGIFAHLHRWFEPFYYLGFSEKVIKNNPNVFYIKARILTEIMQKTCLDYNGLLLLKIIDNSKLAIKYQKFENHPQKDQLNEIIKDCLERLKDGDQSIKELKSEHGRISNNLKDYTPYESFCLNNQMYMNEHSIFCSCSRALKDDLTIETLHEHTKIEWVKEYERILDGLVSDFIVSRNLFYKSQEKTNMYGFPSERLGRKNGRDNLKKSLLKSSFKQAYSILDQIGFATLKVFDIDYEKKLEEIGEGDTMLYFLNIWKKPLFGEEHYNQNFYLTSLYSIAKDLDKTKYSALSEFKLIRNSMEHKIIEFGAEKKRISGNHWIYETEDIQFKTKSLLVLTKSAILTFKNIIRHQSKKYHKDERH